jgi:hypothetical protein
MLKFRSYANAKRFIENHAVSIMLIVNGDDGQLWVVTPRTAARLEAQGYEVVA